LITKNNNKIEYTYYDYLSMDKKNDAIYVRAVWNNFITTANLENYKNIKIWSDGGPKHFKCIKNIAFFASILDSKIEYNFFCSCHGKGPCDGHLGVLKRYIKLKIKTVDIENEDQLLKAINEQKNTTGTLIEIDRTNNYNSTSLKCIKKYHKYCFKK